MALPSEGALERQRRHAGNPAPARYGRALRRARTTDAARLLPLFRRLSPPSLEADRLLERAQKGAHSKVLVARQGNPFGAPPPRRTGSAYRRSLLEYRTSRSQKVWGDERVFTRLLGVAATVHWLA